VPDLGRAAAARRKALRLLLLGILVLVAELVVALNFRVVLFTIVGAHWWLFAEAAERYGWARGYEARGKETTGP
jgi:hypothetical protein